METKILTDWEREEIKKELEKILDVYSGEVQISEKPMIMHHKNRYGNNPPKEYDENLYQVTIESTKGEYDTGHSMHSSWTIKDFVDTIVHEFYMTLDNDPNSPLAKKLWSELSIMPLSFMQPHKILKSMLFILKQYLITFGWALTGAISMAISLGIMLKIFAWLTPINEWEEIKNKNWGVVAIF